MKAIAPSLRDMFRLPIIAQVLVAEGYRLLHRGQIKQSFIDVTELGRPHARRRPVPLPAREW